MYSVLTKSEGIRVLLALTTMEMTCSRFVGHTRVRYNSIQMGSNGKRYTQDFKEGVIRMIRENGRSVASVSSDLGIAEQTIYRWLDKDKTLSSGEMA